MRTEFVPAELCEVRPWLSTPNFTLTATAADRCRHTVLGQARLE
jgi:hypothetical protein